MQWHQLDHIQTICTSLQTILAMCYFAATKCLEWFDVGWQEGHLACKRTEWWRASVVICLEQGADLHMAQLMPLPVSVSCFSKIQTGFTFMVLAHLGSPEKGLRM